MTTARYANLEQGLRNPVERPPARYNQSIQEAAALKVLHDPIEFAQNFKRSIAESDLEALELAVLPKQVDDQRNELRRMLDLAIERKDMEAIRAVRDHYEDFLHYAFGEAQEYGVALGAVLEQLRVGLVSVHELQHRGLTFGDVSERQSIAEIRRKHGLGVAGQDPVEERADA